VTRRPRCGGLGGERGAQLVEFALVLPLLLLVVLGILDFGLLFQRYEVLTNAAREGARVAILPDYEQDDVEARVAQYLEASGLTEEPTFTAVTTDPIPIGGTCMTLTGFSVSYPHAYLFLDGIIGYFGGDALSADSLNVTTYMRSERAAIPCP
jgi:Flp pilus assembly protein TadG